MAIPTDLDYAIFAADVYEDVAGTRVPLPIDWTNQTALLGTQTWARNGFVGAVYVNGDDVVVAFRGTDFEGIGDFNDLVALIAAERLGDQYAALIEFFDAVKAAPQFAGKNITLTGHSLGGALASIIAVREGLSATVFNPVSSSDAAVQATEDVFIQFDTIVDVPDPNFEFTTIPGSGDISNAANITNITTAGEIASQIGTGHVGVLDQLQIEFADPLGTASTPAGFLDKVLGLHSINLSVFLLSEPDRALVELSKQLPTFIPQLVNSDVTGLGGADPDETFLKEIVRLKRDGNIDLVAPMIADLGRLTLGGLARDEAAVNVGFIQLVLQFAAIQIQRPSPDLDPLLAADGNAVSVDLDRFTSSGYDGEIVGKETIKPFVLTRLDSNPDFFQHLNFQDDGSLASIVDPLVNTFDIRGVFVEGTDDLGMIVESTDGKDVVLGGLNDDQLSGGLENDVFLASDGADQVEGGDGSDLVLGEGGHDNLFGDEANGGGSGNDFIFGGAGADLLIGGTGDDVLFGGEGADVLIGFFIDLPLTTGTLSRADYDRIREGVPLPETSVSTLDGGPGDDVLFTGSNSIEAPPQLTARGARAQLQGAAALQADIPPSKVIYREGYGHDVLVQSRGATVDFLGISSNQVSFVTNPAHDPDVNNALILGLAPIVVVLNGQDTLGIPLPRSGHGYFEDFLFFSDGGMSFGDIVAGPVGVQEFPAEWNMSDNRIWEWNETDTPFAPFNNERMAGEDIAGTEGADDLTGTALNDTLSGLGGDDTLSGGAGDDTLDGGAGNDTLDGGTGNDQVAGGAGDDLIVGGSGEGDDALDGGDGTDTITFASTTLGVAVDLAAGTAFGAETGSDGLTNIENVIGGDGGDTITGGAGNNELAGGAGDDVLRGGAGNDVLDGDSGNDIAVFAGLLADYVITPGTEAITVSGPDGTDTLSGIQILRFDDQEIPPPGLTIVGTTGPDVLTGTAGNDRLDGRAGADTLSGRAGADELIGGTGDDILNGGFGDDSLDGGGGVDLLFGDAGSDSIMGGPGGDTIEGGTGADVLDGEAGADTIDGGAGEDQLFGRNGADVLTGGPGNDLLEGGTNDDLLDGEAGADTIDGGDGEDQLFGRNGADILAGGPGDDLLEGGTNNDSLSGEAGNDTLRGGADDDSLDGGIGNDSLDGAGGTDRLDGGAGDDVLTGGLENDVFVFGDGTGQDTITDFGSGDLIDLTAFGFAGIGDLTITDGPTAGDTLVQLDADDSIVLVGVDKATVTQDDFIFA